MSQIAQALTIAGSDSGGGAGIQADLKTFQERKVFGTSVITAITAQNTQSVYAVEEVSLAMIQKQLEVVLADFQITAIKTGMLANQAVIETVTSVLKEFATLPLVVDPVMIAKGGAPLLVSSAMTALKKELIPLAFVITPNLPEVEAILGEKVHGPSEYATAAKKIQQLGAKNVIIKGGHGENATAAVDYILYADGTEEWLTAPRIDTPNTHGTGCTFSACITAELAKGKSVQTAIKTAKKFIQAAISADLKLGTGHGPTNHWAYREVEKHEKF